MSLVPTLPIAARLAPSGVSRMSVFPTAMTGDAAGRTKAATSSPTPTATAALSNPTRALYSPRSLTPSCSQPNHVRVLTIRERSAPRAGRQAQS